MIVLGLMRANLVVTMVSTTLGKAVRYAFLVWGGSFFF
jgi:membrane protein YqaA with SNARE-associated domain